MSFLGAGCVSTAVVALGLFLADLDTPWWVGSAFGTASWACGMGYFLLKWRNVFALPFLYLGVLGMFHLPLVPLVGFGIQTQVNAGWILSDAAGSALLLFTIAVGSMVCGGVADAAIWGAGRDAGHAEEAIAGDNPVLLQAGIGLGILAIGMLGVGAWQMNLFSTGYGEYWAMQADPRLFGTGLSFALYAGVLTSAGAPARWIPRVAGTFVAVLLPFAIFGFRGQFIVYCLAVFPLWYLKRPVFAKRFAAIALVVVVVGSPIIAFTRGRQAASLRDAVERATPVAFLSETGYSLRPLVETYSLVEHRVTDLWMGASYAEAAARVLPNVGESHRQTGDAAPRAPNHWLVYVVEPWHWKRGYGWGFSGVAEPYLNFGIPGVVAFFFLLGIGLSRAELILARRPFMAAWIGCAFGSLLWTARNDFTNFVRPAVWSAVIVGTAYVVHRSKMSREPRSAPAPASRPPLRQSGASWRGSGSDRIPGTDGGASG